MKIGCAFFLVVYTLDGFVDADGLVSQRDVLHLQSAKLPDPYSGKQCDEDASRLPIQIHVDTLNKSLLLIF